MHRVWSGSGYCWYASPLPLFAHCLISVRKCPAAHLLFSQVANQVPVSQRGKIMAAEVYFCCPPCHKKGLWTWEPCSLLGLSLQHLSLSPLGFYLCWLLEFWFLQHCCCPIQQNMFCVYVSSGLCNLHVALSCVALDLLFKLWNPCIHQNRDVGLYSMSLLPFSTLSGSLCGIATGSMS